MAWKTKVIPAVQNTTFLCFVILSLANKASSASTICDPRSTTTVVTTMGNTKISCLKKLRTREDNELSIEDEYEYDNILWDEPEGNHGTYKQRNKDQLRRRGRRELNKCFRQYQRSISYITAASTSGMRDLGLGEEEEKQQIQPPQQSSTSQSLWPPWPFNLLYKQKATKSTSSNVNQNQSDQEYLSGAQIFITFLRTKAKGGFQQMQQFGSALSLHLPPAAPPLIFLAILPTKLKPIDAAVDAVKSTVKTNVQTTSSTGASSKITELSNSYSYLPNSIAKKLALTSLGIAVLSWADYEVRKKKRLTPLPLLHQLRDTRRAIAILPPFLPEAIEPIGLDPLLGSSNSIGIDSTNHNGDNKNSMEEQARQVADKIEQLDEEYGSMFLDSDGNFDMNLALPGLKRSMRKLSQSITPRPKRISLMISSYKKMNQIRKRESAEIKRRKIMDELLVLQQLKKKRREKEGFDWKRLMSNGSSKGNHDHCRDINGGESKRSGMGSESTAGSSSILASPSQTSVSSPQKSLPLGYALVTGASRGIGRALAVELARWNIPLILVARDVEKLKIVAREIETAYGVNCCVLSADLSKPNVAKQVHQATANAGLIVDILINNAGVCTYGDLIDGQEEDIGDMINVNVGSVTHLSYLFGKDMKSRRRGRILFVSSVVGATPGGPGVAAYSATKAYEKSLAQSIGKELEKYGVGVTCIMPGAVKGTSFASRSNADEALCWKFPFYPMSSSNVAGRCVRALLSGDTEVIPGWHNRLFLKILSPLLPQRLTTEVVGFSFSPFQMGILNWPWKRVEHQDSGDAMPLDLQLDMASLKKPPLVLKLPKLDHLPEITQLKDTGEKFTADSAVNETNLDKDAAHLHDKSVSKEGCVYDVPVERTYEFGRDDAITKGESEEAMRKILFNEAE